MPHPTAERAFADAERLGDLPMMHARLVCGVADENVRLFTHAGLLIAKSYLFALCSIIAHNNGENNVKKCENIKNFAIELYGAFKIVVEFEDSNVL